MDVLEHTLFICREVSAFQIPPRPAAGGHKSGDWKVADKVFAGRLRVIAKGDLCELRLEDLNSGDLFASCPVPPGQRPTVVEPAADSSRNFVLRIVDTATGRHAFLGLSFADRSEAFDFNVALSDHEKQLRRAVELKQQAATTSTGSNASAAAPSLVPQADLSLKEGQTIRVNVKREGRAGGFLSQMRTSGDGSSISLPPPPPAGSMVQPQRIQQSNDDFLGLGEPAIAPVKQQPQPSKPADSWTTF